jgi:hypothetical protein
MRTNAAAPDHRLKAYRARLPAHPSGARVVDEARPYRSSFPLGAPDRDWVQERGMARLPGNRAQARGSDDTARSRARTRP